MRILVLRGKNGNQYYDATGDDKLHSLALAIVADRSHEEWYDGKDLVKARRIVEAQNGKAAFDFLSWHGDMEYEGFSLEIVESDYS